MTAAVAAATTTTSTTTPQPITIARNAKPVYIVIEARSRKEKPFTIRSHKHEGHPLSAKIRLGLTFSNAAKKSLATSSPIP